jgi:hypothetical protein
MCHFSIQHTFVMQRFDSWALVLNTCMINSGNQKCLKLKKFFGRMNSVSDCKKKRAWWRAPGMFRHPLSTNALLDSCPHYVRRTCMSPAHRCEKIEWRVIAPSRLQYSLRGYAEYKSKSCLQCAAFLQTGCFC